MIKMIIGYWKEAEYTAEYDCDCEDNEDITKIEVFKLFISNLIYELRKKICRHDFIKLDCTKNLEEGEVFLLCTKCQLFQHNKPY